MQSSEGNEPSSFPKLQDLIDEFFVEAANLAVKNGEYIIVEGYRHGGGYILLSRYASGGCFSYVARYYVAKEGWIIRPSNTRNNIDIKAEEPIEVTVNILRGLFDKIQTDRTPDFFSGGDPNHNWYDRRKPVTYNRPKIINEH